MKDFYFDPSDDRSLPPFYTQSVEELVRQINQAQRWMAVEELIQAIMKLRRDAEKWQKEYRHIHGVDKVRGECSPTIVQMNVPSDEPERAR